MVARQRRPLSLYSRTAERTQTRDVSASYLCWGTRAASPVVDIASLVSVIIQYLLHQVIHNFDWLNWLHIMQKRIVRLIPYISLFHDELSFFETAVQNTRCRRLPNRLHDIVCLSRSRDNSADPCCGLDCADGVCRNQLNYFKNFEDDTNFEESIVYLSLTPILYFTLLIMIEEKFFKKLFTKTRKLKMEQETMDDQVKKEKLTVALEINKINSQNKNVAKQEPKVNSADAINSELLHSPTNEDDSLFLVYELSKYYGKLMAVKKISF
nr:PREDICTED: uncharacterized protein LOC105668591 [Linepithema humile]